MSSRYFSVTKPIRETIILSYPVILSHRRSTKVYLETYPLYSFIWYIVTLFLNQSCFIFRKCQCQELFRRKLSLSLCTSGAIQCSEIVSTATVIWDATTLEKQLWLKIGTSAIRTLKHSSSLIHFNLTGQMGKENVGYLLELFLPSSL